MTFMTPLETQVVLMLFASFVTEFTSNSMAATLLVPVVSELVSVSDPERNGFSRRSTCASSTDEISLFREWRAQTPAGDALAVKPLETVYRVELAGIDVDVAPKYCLALWH